MPVSISTVKSGPPAASFAENAELCSIPFRSCTACRFAVSSSAERASRFVRPWVSSSGSSGPSASVGAGTVNTPWSSLSCASPANRSTTASIASF